jgi:hypothetical protein
MSSRDPFVGTFGDILLKEFQRRGFAHLGGPAEKHGGWEWSFGQSGYINRYVIIAGVSRPRQTTTGAGTISLEIAVGADHDDRFIRRVVARGFNLTGIQLQIVPKSFLLAVSEAIAMAQRLTLDDLTDRYLPPRTRERP